MVFLSFKRLVRRGAWFNHVWMNRKEGAFISFRAGHASWEVLERSMPGGDAAKRRGHNFCVTYMEVEIV